MGIRWQELHAARASSIHPSFNVPFDKMPRHPDLIPFTGGTPSPEFLPIRHLQACNERAWNLPHEAMYYGDTGGYPPLLERISERMSRRGIQVPTEQILVTNGAQQGLDLISRILLDPGDTVIVEAPTYFGALQVFDMFQASYQSVELDEHGMIPESLEAALKAARRPKFIYTVPTYHNPTGVTISEERRRRIIALAGEFNVPIVEDDPYGELWFGQSGTNPLRADSEDVIYLGTFSKTIAPAIRMGWMCAPRELIRIAQTAKEATDISSDRIVQRMVVEATNDGWLDQHLDAARENYAGRFQAVNTALERHMPDGVTWTNPTGGFFVWVSLPGETNSLELLPKVMEAGALYLPGSIFYVDQRQSPSFRLGFTTLPIERYEEGISRMGRALAIAI